jgi:hypothetical protein
MHRIVLSVIAAVSSFVGLLPASETAAEQSLTSLSPAITFEDGSSTERQAVLDVVDRFVSSSMALPALHFRFHDELTGCDGHRGLYHRDGDVAVIDFCSDREILLFHEVGHAWEQFTLDDADRDAFLKAAGAESWQAREIEHNRRGAEIAADTIAYALLSRPDAAVQTRPIELFETLVGMESPRVVEREAAEAEAAETTPATGMDDEERSARAAYAAWQAQEA